MEQGFDNGSVRAIPLDDLASIAGACELVDELYPKRLEHCAKRGSFGRCMFLNLDCDDVTNGRLAILWVSLLPTCKRAT